MNPGRSARFCATVGLAFIGVVLLLVLLNAQHQAYAAAGAPAPGIMAGPEAAAAWPALHPPAVAWPAPLANGAPTVITVCSSCPYKSIQDAVNAVASGGTVQVAQGVYTSTDAQVVALIKPLVLQGGYATTNWNTPDPIAHPTILDGEGTRQVIYIGAVTATLAGFHIRRGNASDGGGVYIAGGNSTLSRNRIYSNTANSGGGVYVADGRPSVQNNLIYTNTALRGGGVYVNSGSPVFQHNTLYRNLAGAQGGGFYLGSATSVVSATIVASNTAASGGGLYAADARSDYNDVWGNAGGDYAGGLAAGSHSTSTNPLFASLNFADPAGFLSLRAGSPCINRVPAAQSLTEDYRGAVRPLGAQADMGAFEFYAGICFARVDSSGVYTSVQAAVDAAGAGSLIRVAGLCQGVSSRIVGSGRYTQTVYISRPLTLQGGYTVTDWVNSLPVTRPTFLDAQSLGRVVCITNNVTATIQGFHILNGQAASGAGVYVGAGNSVIANNRIYSNTASGSNSQGGGLYLRGGKPTLRANWIYNNAATASVGSAYGGGLYIYDGGAGAEGNLVYNNIVTATSGEGQGGGLYLYKGASSFWGNQVSTNTAKTSGGGLYLGGDSTVGALISPTLENNQVYSNTTANSGSTKGGGGIYVDYGKPLIRRNQVYRNVAKGAIVGRGGGGIFIYGRSNSPATVERNAIHHNDGGTYGGGIYIYDQLSPQVILNNLVYENTATNGGGISVYFGHGSTAIKNNTVYKNISHGINRVAGLTTISIYNNIVVSNTGWGVNSALIAAYYSDVWGNAGGNCNPATACAAANGNISSDPLFSSVAVTSPAFLRLQSSSPCRDTADPNPNNYPREDYAGYARPFGPRADMGAHEYYAGTCFAQVSSVTPPTRIFTDVQAAVYSATANALVKVAGVCDVTHTVGGLTQTVYISQALTLRGGYTLTNWSAPGALTTLDAQGDGRVVYITRTSAVTVDGFIIQHGRAISGGGLYLAQALSPTIRNVVFYSNTAGLGGGLAAAGGNPRLYNNTFVSNQAAASGGGLYLAAGSPQVSNTIVVSNSASSGGGVFAAAGAAPTLDYDDLWHNTPDDSNVSTGTHSLSADPRFTATFHLGASSPCVNAGDPNTRLAWDFEGSARPLPPGSAWYDIGADEGSIYPGMSLTPRRQVKNGLPGQTIVYNHVLTNTGTIPDTIELTHQQATRETTAGWEVISDTAVFTLTAGQVVAVLVSVIVPGDAISGSLSILTLTARSQANPAIAASVVDTTTVNRSWGVQLAPSHSERVNPGAVITYVHTLTNAGNMTDTFNLNQGSTMSAWSKITLTPTQVSGLGPWLTATVWARVEVTDTAPGGLVGTLVITASRSGDGGPTLRAVVTDTTRVNHTPGDRYVAKTGKDTLNNCQVPARPCLTIAYAIGQATNGDAIKVAAGTYNEYNLSLNKNVVLRGGYATSDWDTFAPAANPTIVDARGLGRVLAIYGSPTVEGFTLRGGSTSGLGGGIYIGLGAPTIARNRLTLNSAGRGGALAVSSGSPRFWNNMVYDNSASLEGGGVYVAGSMTAPRLWHNTLYSNTAGRGGGLYLADGWPVVSNTIIVSNTAVISGGGIYKGGGWPAFDHNDVWGNAGGNYGGVVTPTDDLYANPLFVNPAVRNLHLQEISPLIDKGKAVTLLAVDFDGHPRKTGLAPDVGADEFLRVGVDLAPSRSGWGIPGGSVVYTHTLVNTGNYTDTFHLTRKSSRGWSVAVSPTPVTLGAGQSRTITMTVLLIPYGTLSGTLETTIVTATSSLDLAVHDTVVDTTTVGPARGVLLAPDRTRNVNSGVSPAAVVYTHRLTNTGNLTDTFNWTWHSSQGWAVVIYPPPVPLGPGASVPVWVTVTVPAGIPTTTLRVDVTLITATSSGDVTVHDTVTDTTIVNQRAGVRLTPDHTGSGEYDHVLTNTGNYTDTFDLAIIQGPGNVNPSRVTLGANQMATVHVAVTSGACGAQLVTVVQATSQFDPSVSDTAVDTTTVPAIYTVSFEADQVAHVTSDPAQPVVVNYTHRLTNTGNCTNTFTLDKTSSQGWSVTVVPTRVTLVGGAATSVAVAVSVPPHADGCSNLLVDATTATATGSQGGTDSVRDTTIVNRCAGVRLAPSLTRVITQPFTGSVVVVYTHRLTNTGNYTDTFSLAGQSEHAWNVSVQPSAATLGGNGAARSVEVRVTVPADVYSTTDRAFIVATSQFSPTVQASVVDTTTVARPHVRFYPSNTGRAGPGTLITYTHWLNNDGALADTYVLTWTSRLGWTAAMTPATVYTLSPGVTLPLSIAVSVPPNTPAWTTDTLVITASSRSYAGVWAPVVNTTTVPYVPGVRLTPIYNEQADPGVVMVYTHTLTNTGNYTDTFLLTTLGQFAYAEISPTLVGPLGPGQVYTQVVVTGQILPHSASGQTEPTQIIAQFGAAEGQAVFVDSTYINFVNGPRHVARIGGDDYNNNCLWPEAHRPCATLQHAVDQALSPDEVRVAHSPGRVYTDVHAINTAGGVFTQVVYLSKSLTLRGGYYVITGTADWSNSDPVARPTVLDARGRGRVVYATGAITPTIEGLYLQGGSTSGSDDGAGLYIAAGTTPTVQSNVIYSNTSRRDGGGVYWGSQAGALQRNTIYSNTANRDGAGLYVYTSLGRPNVWNNVIYRNRASGLGGGLYNGRASNPLIWNNTFYSNTASQGGGLYLAGGEPTISNTIVVHNSAPAGGGLYRAGGNPVLAYNDVWANTGGNYSGVTTPTTGLSADPRFANTVAYDLHLSGASPCIDAGDPGATLPDDDRDGTPRPLLLGYDVGAYEYALTSGKWAAPAANPGQVLTYTLVITNGGAQDWPVAVVSDTLHRYLDYGGWLTYTAGHGEYLTATRTISWTGPVAKHSAVTITFAAVLTDWLAAGVSITNVAWINYTATDVVTTVVNSLPGPRYVTTSGSDADNSCRVSRRPCRTAQYAVNQALTNDPVRVAAGTFTAPAGAGQVVGIAGKTVALTGGYTSTTWAYDPENYPTYLDGQGSRYGVIITGPATAAVAGFRIHNGAEGVRVLMATATISRTRLYNQAGPGAYARNANLTMERTWVYSNANGVQVEGSAYRLINNVLAHNMSTGLRASGSGTLKHNTLARNGAAGALISGTAAMTNTIFYSQAVGMRALAGGWLKADHSLWDAAGVYTSASGGVIQTSNTFVGDPRFVDPDTLNYHINADSPALDRGLEVGVHQDIDGGWRPQSSGPDIGADEFPLEIVKRVVSSAAPGATITYTIGLTNETDMAGLVLTDTLNAAFLSYAGGLTCTAGAGECGYLASQHAITWTGHLAAGQPVYITFTARITDWLAAGVQVTNAMAVQIEGYVFRTVPVVTTIRAVAGTRYAAPAGRDADYGAGNNCRMSWKPCRTLQWTVDQAMDGDTLQVAQGTYTGAGSSVATIAKSLTLQGGYTTTWAAPDPAVYPTIVDGQGSRRAFSITGAGPVTLAGFHLTRGRGGNGGGLLISGARVTLADLWVYSNTASASGGGIYASGSMLTLSASEISTNTASASGGGLYADGGSLAITATQVRANTSGDQGGGLALFGSSGLRVERSTILANQAGKQGGGAAIDIAPGRQVTLTNTVVGANLGSGGDGLAFLSATNAGGRLRHMTLAENDGEGVRVGSGWNLALTNTILVSHTLGISVAAGSAVTADHTLWWGTPQPGGGLGSFTATNDAAGHPRFVKPAALDYHIRGDSAALNAGTWVNVSDDIDDDRRLANMVDTGADQYPLRLARRASPTPVAPCCAVTHTLVLTNLSGAPLAEVWLGDRLDADSVAGSATATAGWTVTSSHAISWTGPVDMAAPTVITYTASIAPYLANGAVLAYTATVTDAISTFSTPPMTLTVRTLPATLAKTAPAQASIGQVVTYTVVFSVPKGHVAYRPSIVEVLPRLVAGSGISTTPALTYVVGSASAAGASILDETLAANGGAITWTLGTVTATCSAPAVASLTLAAQVRDLPDSGAGDPLTNTVNLSYTESSAGGPPRFVTAQQLAWLVEPQPAIVKKMPADLGAGDEAIVSLVVSNTGTGALYDMTVTDTLPADLVVQSATAPYSLGGRVLTWTLAALGAGQQRVYTIAVRVADTIGPGVSLTNTARIVGTSAPGVTSQERTYAAVTYATAKTGYPDLALNKERGPAVRSPGQTITYTLRYANHGAVRAMGVIITDTLPLSITGVVSTSSATAQVTRAGQVVTWTLSAPVSRSVTGAIQITGTVRPGTPDGTVLTNKAGITTVTQEPITANNGDAVATTVRWPSLGIAKTTIPEAVLPGELLTYVLTISNTGLGDATSLRLSDTVPPSTTYQFCAGGPCGLSGSVVTWTVALLPAGSQVAVTFVVRADPDLPYGAYVVNSTYGVTSTQGVGAAGAALSTKVGLIGGVRLEPDGASRGLPDQSIIYHHTLTNTANTAQTVNLQAGSSRGWTVDVSPASVHLLSRATAPVVVTVTVDSSAISGTVDSTVVTATGTITGSDTATDATTVELRPGVSLEPDNASRGLPAHRIVYHHILTNTSNTADTFMLSAASSEGWPVNVSPLSLSLAAGAHSEIVVTVTVGSSALSGIVDTSVITAQGAVAGQDTATDRTTAELQPGLSLEPETRQQSVSPGESAVYTHTLTNLGNAPGAFDLAVSPAPSDWTFDLQPVQMSGLAPGASRTVTLTVGVPLGGTGQAVAVITAIWHGMPSVLDTAIDTTIIGCIPVANAGFTYSPAAPIIRQTITFTGTVEAGSTPPVGLAWDFGDGATGSGTVVTHAYSADGPYTVALTATNACGQAPFSREITVRPYSLYLPLVLQKY